MAETLEPGVTVRGVADRYGVRASRVSDWRRLAKDAKLVLPAAEGPPGFAPLAVCDAQRPAPEAEGVAAGRDVRIAVGAVVIRLDADTCPTRIAGIVRALGGAGMMMPAHKVRILVATRPVDVRKGHDGLAALVQSALQEDPLVSRSWWKFEGGVISG